MKPYQRKTYRQLRDTVDIKKGALWQEACDDGTQGFGLLTEEHIKHGELSDFGGEFYPRAAVTGQPQWFEEVFKVTPEYVTQPELDEWEAFKKVKSKKKPTVAKRKVGRPRKN